MGNNQNQSSLVDKLGLFVAVIGLLVTLTDHSHTDNDGGRETFPRHQVGERRGNSRPETRFGDDVTSGYVSERRRARRQELRDREHHRFRRRWPGRQPDFNDGCGCD